MEITSTKLKNVFLIKPKVYKDDRGFFLESFQQKSFNEQVQDTVSFVQDNHSHSSKGVLRGLHFQKKNAQGKLIYVVKGKIFDVAVDIDPSSSTYKQWVGFELSEHNNLQLYVPPGYAHGFLTLAKQNDIIYKCTNYYDPSNEETLIWNDKEINIDWPISQLNENIILSPKDSQGKTLQQLQ